MRARVDTLSYEAPGWGVGDLALAGGRPVHHDAPSPARRPQARHLDATICDPDARDPGERLVARVGAYFAGVEVTFEPALVGLEETLAELDATPLQRSLARALAGVGHGCTLSYAALAEIAGRPRAARAAGALCAHNPLFLFLPCHRIVGSDGIGGYGDLGVAYKRRLLALEGVQVQG